MVVMVPREKWTDERLDDLNTKVDRGFADTKREMGAGFARLDKDVRELREELKNLNRNLIGGLFVLLAAIIGSNAF